jgi:methyl-accepting chemotaxis protein
VKLADLKIGVRLGVAFGAVLVLLVAITVVAELKMAQMNARTEHLVRHDYRLVALGTTALDNTRGSIARVFQLVGDADPARLKTSAERLDINLAEVDKALADLDKAGLEGGMRDAHARANAALVRYKAAVAQVRREIAGGRTREATAAAYGEAYPALHALAKEIRALVDQADNALDAAATTSTADYRTALAMMLAIGAIAVALGGALAR